ncbi:DUF4160 domain-containing protein [Peteryoungia desertarenae]|uniref:DUF4160 domain-containing protein n=2 Tax=Peteryoungia desertarenae TaxID=1813451 RepID=A0ABX6QMB9_9HYPH|nr:DUF4160 domain-containing protein [Peteryoungia desertarenae]
MVTVFRKHGMRFVIYTADHEPPHVHVYGDGEARIDILRLTVITQGGMSDRDVRRAVDEIEAQQEMLIDIWRRYHG